VIEHPTVGTGRLVAILLVIAVGEALFFSLLTPLLPYFEREFALSKTEAGLLVAVFAIGWIMGAIPPLLMGDLIGTKNILLVGLLILALTSLLFGIIDSYSMLLLLRFLQGVAATFCFSGALAWLVDITPRQRRSETIGIYSGAAAAGSMLGAGVGGLAGKLGLFPVLGVLSVLLLCVSVLIGLQSAPREPTLPSNASLWKVHYSRHIIGPQGLVILPGFLIGMILVLAPLELNQVGLNSLAIGAVFFVAAAIGVLARPYVGRWADRQGALVVLHRLLLLMIPLTLVVPWMSHEWIMPICVIVAVTTYGVCWGPSMVIVSRAYEDAHVAQLAGFALMSVTSGVGVVLGSAAAGAIADVAGDAAAYTLGALACVAILIAYVSPSRRSMAGAS